MHQISRVSPSALAELSPAYFGMVMTTGMVSIRSWRPGFSQLGQVLFALNIAACFLLWMLYLTRVIRYPRLFARDLVDHLQGPGFFTMVVASSILGSQFLLQADNIFGALNLRHVHWRGMQRVAPCAAFVRAVDVTAASRLPRS